MNQDYLNSILKGINANNQQIAQEQKKQAALDQYKQFLSQGQPDPNAAAPDGGNQEPWWKKVGDWAVNTGKGIAGTAERVAGTAAQGVVSAAGAGELAYRLATGDKAGAEKRAQDYNKTITDIGHAKAIDNGSMSFISDKTLDPGKATDAGDALKKTLQFGAEFGNAGVNTAAFVQPELKGLTLPRAIATEAGVNGVTGAAGNALDQYAQTGQVDAGQVAQAAAENAILAGTMRGAKGLKDKITGKGATPEAATTPTDTTTAPTDVNAGRVDLTDTGIPEQLRVRAMRDGTGYIPEGKTIQRTPTEPTQPAQLPATTEKPADIQAQIAELQKGNFDPSHYDVKTSDGQKFTSEDVAAATQKQTDILTQRQADLAQQRDAAMQSGDQQAAAAADKGVQDLQAQIDDINKNGVTPTGSPVVDKSLNADKVRATFADLQQRLVQAKNQEAADAKFKQENSFVAPNRSPEQAAADLEAAKNGKVPDSVKTEMPDFQSAQDVASAMPSLSQQAQDITSQKLALTQELQNTLTPDKAEQVKAQIDQKYEAQRAAVQDMPDVRKKYELDKINQGHLQELQGIDQQLAETGPKAQDLQSQLDQVNAQEQDMVMKANFIKNNNAGQFQVVDAKAQADHIINLEKEKVVNSAFPTPDETNSVITNTMVRTDSPEQFAARLDNDQAVKTAFDQKVDSAMALSIKTEKPGANLISSPLDVLRRWGDRGKFMADELQNAHMEFARDRGAFVDQAKTWHDDLAGAPKGAADRVFQALDGKDVKLDPAEQATHDSIRAYLDTMASKLGLTEKDKVSDYIPHMFEQSFGKNYGELEKIAAMVRYGVDEAGKKIDAAQQDVLAKQLGNIDAESLDFIRSNNSWKIKNGHLEQRTGAQGYSQDLFKVLSSYDNIANKKIHYEPAMQTVNAISGDLLTEQKRYLTDFFARIKGDHSSTFENTLDRFIGDGNTAKFLANGRRLSNASVMGLSPLTWVKNMQDTSKVWADRPIKHVVSSIPQAIAAMKYGSTANRELFTHGIMESNQASFLKGMAADASTEKFGAVKNAALKAESAMWSGMRATDAFTRALNYHASIKEFMEKNPGAAMDDAIKYAQKTNRDTVFSFSDMDVPVALNNAIGRSTLNMQTYNLQTAKYIMKTFGNVLEKTDNGYKFSPEGFAKMSKYVAANVAFMATVGTALGLKPQDLVPFGNEIAGGQLPQSPLVAQLVGNQYQKGLIPTASATISDLFKAATGAHNDLATSSNDLGQAVMGAAGGLVPLATQAKRTTEGIQSVTDGIAKSSKGNYQFNQNQDPVNAMMAAVFGKTTTDAGKVWKNNGSQTLSPQQMQLGQPAASGVSITKLSPADQKKYTDFYNAVNVANPYDFTAKKDARTIALEDARKAAKNGDINAVNRTIQNFNANAAKPLNGFLSQYGNDIPPAIADNMSKLFIAENDLVPQGWKP